jgi:hypothetical protein
MARRKQSEPSLSVGSGSLSVLVIFPNIDAGEFSKFCHETPLYLRSTNMSPTILLGYPIDPFRR